MNHSRDSSLKFVSLRNEQGNEAKRLFWMHRVSSSWQLPISSGILEIMFEAMLSFLSSTSCPILEDRTATLFYWKVNSYIIFMSKSSSGNLVNSFLSSLRTLTLTIALIWWEISSILFALKSSICTLGKLLQKSPSMIWILLLDKLSRTILSNRLGPSA